MAKPEEMMSIGLSLFQQQDFTVAAAHFDKAVLSFPELPDFHNLAGLCRMENNDLPGAENCFRKAISLSPEFISYRVNLADCLLVLGKPGSARDLLRERADLMQDSGPAWTNLGQAQEALGCYGEALSCYRRALDLQPGELVCYLNLARGLENCGLAAEALELLSQVHQQVPFQLECGVMMIALFVGMDRYEDAINIATAWRQHHPHCAELDMNEAVAWQKQGQYEQAKALYRQAMTEPSLVPTTAGDAETALAMLCLLQEDWQTGWTHWQARFNRTEPGLKETGLPVWDGKALADGRLLVRADQGYGDSLQFWRYLSVAARQAQADIVFECQPALHTFLQQADPDLALLVRNDVPPADCVAEVAQLNLPWILSVYEPLPMPAISIAPRKKRTSNLDIGFVCKGSDGHLNDHRRSIDSAMLEPLMSPGRQFWCLQPDADRDLPVGAQQMAHSGQDFHETVRQFAALDLVLSVDTAIAHLAGCAGMPCWLLLPFDPDWRWGLGQESTIWYPSLKIFRQQAPGDWQSVIDEIRAALVEMETP